ncbi:unnamed protein product, partial [marine sediment metagenome]
DAEFSFAMKRFKEARTRVVHSIKMMGKESLSGLNLLGKCLINLNDLEGAVKCFEKAQSISPKNLARICQIADVQSDLGEVDKAQGNIDKAKALDEGAEVVQKSEIKVAMVIGDSEKAQALMGNLENMNDMVAQMNNRAVAYIRSKDFGRGEKIYQETIDSVPDRETELKAKVLYNMGLAHARQGQLKGANDWLAKAADMGEESMKLKIGSLGGKVKRSLKSGNPLKLSKSDAEVSTSDEEAQVMGGEAEEGSYVGEDNQVEA